MSKVLIDRELLIQLFQIWDADLDVDDEMAQLRIAAAQPSEAEGDRIASGFVILDGMAFSKDEILTQRKDLCDALEELEAMRAFVESDARRYRTLRQMHWNDGPLAVVAYPKANVKLGVDCPSGERLDQMLDQIDEQRYPR